MKEEQRTATGTHRLFPVLMVTLGALACESGSMSRLGPDSGAAEGPSAAPASFLSGLGPVTLVSITFDDGFASQAHFIQFLEANDITSLRGTFFLNSSRLDLERGERATRDQPRYAPLEVWQQAARVGHEIGSHSISHVDLSCTPERFEERLCQPGHEPIGADEVRRQICGDKQLLESLGFEVAGFAYPYGRDVGGRSPSIHTVAATCGFRYGRDTSGLARGTDDPRSGDRPIAEGLPARNRFSIRSYGSLDTGVSFPEMRRWILDVHETGGGWAPLVFHHVSEDCQDPENPGQSLGFCVAQRDLEELVLWLHRAGEAGGAPEGVLTRTMREIMSETDRFLRLPVANGTLEARHNGSVDRPNCFDRFGGRHDANFERSSATLELERAASGQGGDPVGVDGHFEKMFPTESHPRPLVTTTTRDDRCYLPVTPGRSYELRIRARSVCAEPARGQFVLSGLRSTPAGVGWDEAAFAPPDERVVPATWTRLRHVLSPVSEGIAALAFGLRYTGPEPPAGCQIWVDDFEVWEARDASNE